MVPDERRQRALPASRAKWFEVWRLKYRYLEKEKKLALGLYPEVTLAYARELQIDARRLLASGIDPCEHRRQAKRTAKVAAVSTFEAVAREWFAKFSTNWAKSHSSKVLLRLENKLFPMDRLAAHRRT
jgi:hypothetical protein